MPEVVEFTTCPVSNLVLQLAQSSAFTISSGRAIRVAMRIYEIHEINQPVMIGYVEHKMQ